MAKAKNEYIEVKPANMQYMTVTIVGDAPLVLNNFPEKARQMMREAQEAGGKRKSKSAREAKDFKACWEEARHLAAPNGKDKGGWDGIPAPAFRAAMISACRVAGIVMTRAKLTVFVEADGFDKVSGQPLVKITKGKPVYHEAAVRNASGVADIRPRPMWHPGWEAKVTIRWDGDQMDEKSIANLLYRAGQQVGIGEGRPDSKASCGCGWGTFKIQE